MRILTEEADGPRRHDTSRNSKRKLDDDCFRGSDFSDLPKMSKTGSMDESEERCLQFFVKLINGKTILIRLRSSGTVLDVIKMVEMKSGIPVRQQRVIYCGRQLSDESVLSDCGISNDSIMHVVARVRSTRSCRMWQEVEEINDLLRRLLCSEGRNRADLDMLQTLNSDMIGKFLTYRIVELENYVSVLIDSCFPAQLMKLYLSVKSSNQKHASDFIQRIIISSLISRDIPESACFYPLILEFGKMLSTVGYEDNLYLYCRKALARLVFYHCTWKEVMSSFPDILPFVKQAAEKISADLVSESHDSSPSTDAIRDLNCFFELLKLVVIKGSHGRALANSTDDIPNADTTRNHALEVTTYIYPLYKRLLENICAGLLSMENICASRKHGYVHPKACRLYLPILKLLYSISKLYLGADERYQAMLGSRKAALSCLILTYSKSIDDLFWLVELKGFIDFKAKSHLVDLLFPNEQFDYHNMNELLIDRSNLLAESFEYIRHADRDTLHSTLFVEFKNEVATGPGVLREWFIMVCQAIFYTGNPLFTACPNDRRRFYLNPASKVDPLHSDYLRFCGRVIALALRHNVQVGIVFDRVFFLQLAALPITLEDIKEADPEFYRSCKNILDMDADFVDTDALGLTFVREVDGMGIMNVSELCPGGKSKVVNSHNIGKYVELLVLNRFVISTSNQLQYFTEGFGDILAHSSLSRLFFKMLDLEDLDLLLQGSATDISVEDWKAHTVYNCYKKTDSQIAWFWKIVGKMSAEQKRALLFFWTSVKYLPPEGFHGLKTHLLLSKVSVSLNRLPTSQTCFSKLCLPAYSSKKMMQARLNVIIQEHVSSSFGSY